VEGYNGLTSCEILGAPAPGVSTGQAMAIMQGFVDQLPRGITSEWTGLSYEEAKAGAQTGPLYAISLLLILLCLAALYESWPIPVAVLLVVPLGVIGAIAGTLLRGLDNGVYFQVGLLTTVGLAVKNAILIVEFAKAFYDAGLPLVTSAIKAAEERLRPHPHDLHRLRPRHPASGRGRRRWGRQPYRHRHGRGRRHDKRTRCWPSFSYRSFRGCAAAVPGEAQAPPGPARPA